VTAEVYQRRKIPFVAPPTVAFPDEPVHQMLQDTLRSELVLQSLPFFDRARVLTLLDAVPAMNAEDRIALSGPCNLLLTAALLAKEFCLTP